MPFLSNTMNPVSLMDVTLTKILILIMPFSLLGTEKTSKEISSGVSEIRGEQPMEKMESSE